MSVKGSFTRVVSLTEPFSCKTSAITHDTALVLTFSMTFLQANEDDMSIAKPIIALKEYVIESAQKKILRHIALTVECLLGYGWLRLATSM